VRELKNIVEAEKVIFSTMRVPVQLASGQEVHVERLRKGSADRVRKQFLEVYDSFISRLLDLLPGLKPAPGGGDDALRLGMEVDLQNIGELLRNALHEVPDFVDALVEECVPELRDPEVRKDIMFDELWGLAGIALEVNLIQSELIGRFFSVFTGGARALRKTKLLAENDGKGESAPSP